MVTHMGLVSFSIVDVLGFFFVWLKTHWHYPPSSIVSYKIGENNTYEEKIYTIK